MLENVCRERKEEKRTEMRIFLILIPSRPEERSHATCAFDSTVWQVHLFDHRLIHFGWEADNMWSEGFGVFCILLESGTISIPSSLKASQY
jgi:hypothetical protein